MSSKKQLRVKENLSRSLSIRASTRIRRPPPTQTEPRRRPEAWPLIRRNGGGTAQRRCVWVEFESQTEKTLAFAQFCEDVGGGDTCRLDVLPDLEKEGQDVESKNE